MKKFKNEYKNEYKRLMNDCVCIIYEAQDFFELFDSPVPRPVPLNYILKLYVRLNIMFDRLITFFQNNYEKMSYIDKVHYDINDGAIQSLMMCLEKYLKHEHNIDMKGECKL